jgi:hypothetical protein
MGFMRLREAWGSPGVLPALGSIHQPSSSRGHFQYGFSKFAAAAVTLENTPLLQVLAKEHRPTCFIAMMRRRRQSKIERDFRETISR